MAARMLQEFLDREQVKYVTIHHSPAYTAQEIAASAHVRGRELAKVVVLKLDGKMALAVVPASVHVDLGRVRQATGARKAEIATESDFANAFPECELGAMPPFGHLYGMPVFVDDRLTQDVDIAFNAGSHSELIRMAYRDFERLAKPEVAPLAAAT